MGFDKGLLAEETSILCDENMWWNAGSTWQYSLINWSWYISKKKKKKEIQAHKKMRHEKAMGMTQDRQTVIDEILFWKINQSIFTFLQYSK